MRNGDIALDRNRRDRLLDRVDEILRRNGTELHLRSRQDVVILAVQELWTRVSNSDSMVRRALVKPAAD